MAADPKKIKEIADLLDQIQKQYNKLGEKNPFKGMDPNKVKDVDKEIKRLETSLEGVESKARRIDTTFGDLQGTLESITKEISQKQNSSLNKLTKGMRSLTSEARKLADEEVGINTLSKKQLEKIKERALSSQRAAKDSAASLLEDMKINLKKEGSILKQIKSNKKLTKEQKEQAIAAANILKDRNQIQGDLINKIQDRIDLEDKFNRKLGIAGQLAKGLDNALQKAGLPSMGIASAIEEARENFIKTNGESSVFKDTMKGIGKNLKEAVSFTNIM
jgi:transcriptional regulator NrdR family protein